MRFTTLLVVIVAFAICSALGDDEPSDGYFSPELECNRQGGLCIHEDLCDSDAMDEAACPSQKSKGAVCCHKLPSNETRCQKHGGQCMPTSDCGRIFIAQAKDCSQGEICCVLLS